MNDSIKNQTAQDGQVADPRTDADRRTAALDSGHVADAPVQEEPQGARTESPGVMPGSDEITTESVVEAILFAADSPLPASKIAQVLGVGDARDVKKHIETLNAKYAQNGCSFRVEAIAKGHQMVTLPQYNGWLSKLLRARTDTKLSPAALETLAIVAYKQPVLRVDIEVIRGVAAGDMVNRLREMNLVKIVGRAEELGRPMLYGTTRRFLEVFGLASLDDLPKAEELAPPAEGPPATEEPQSAEESPLDEAP